MCHQQGVCWGFWLEVQSSGSRVPVHRCGFVGPSSVCTTVEQHVAHLQFLYMQCVVGAGPPTVRQLAIRFPPNTSTEPRLIVPYSARVVGVALALLFMLLPATAAAAAAAALQAPCRKGSDGLMPAWYA